MFMLKSVVWCNSIELDEGNKNFYRIENEWRNKMEVFIIISSSCQAWLVR